MESVAWLVLWVVRHVNKSGLFFQKEVACRSGEGLPWGKDVWMCLHVHL